MFLVILAGLFLIAAFVAPVLLKKAEFPSVAQWGASAGCAAVALLMFGMTSFVYVGANEVGLLNKVYGSKELPQGRVIATDGEKGWQAKTIKPGFHIIPFVSVIYDVTKVPAVTVPAGFYGLIEARDGKPLPEGAIMADEWPEDEEANMLEAQYFLTNDGQRGLQASILTPGTYFLNLHLFKVTYGNGRNAVVCSSKGCIQKESSVDTRQTTIPEGFVGVVTSKIKAPNAQCEVKEKVAVDEEGNPVIGALSVPLVDVGCKGVWKEALRPGGYFLNNEAYKVTLVDTRVQAWTYAGGYESRKIDLQVDQEGQITQSVSVENVPVPKGAADEAVDVKVEGWTVHQNLRALVQVTPENAPIVVASVGGLEQVEDRVLTPAIWSEVRDVVGGVATLPKVDEEGRVVLDENGNVTLVRRPVRILDVMENRDYLQREVDSKVREHGRKAGVNIMEVRFGNPDIPPEMLVARKREQLATQLARAFVQEKEAQEKRIETKAAEATANQQAELVKAQIAVQVAEQRKLERDKLGEAEKLYLKQVAEGEKARAMVLGEDRVMMLNLADKILATLTEKPELVGLVSKLVPNTVVTGSSGGIDGAAAILGGVLDKATKSTK